MKFYKILDESGCSGDLKFRTGWNEDFTHGIYFAARDILAFLDDGPWIREVKKHDEEIQEIGAHFVFPQKFKSPRVLLGPRRKLTLKVIKELVEAGANIHAGNDTALRWASLNDHLDVVRYLIEHGVDVHVDNDSALCVAATNGYLDVVRYLVEHGADIHADNDSALRWAALYDHLDVVQYLVEHGANVNVDNDCILRFASRNGYLDIMQYLVEHRVTM